MTMLEGAHIKRIRALLEERSPALAQRRKELRSVLACLRQPQPRDQTPTEATTSTGVTGATALAAATSTPSAMLGDVGEDGSFDLDPDAISKLPKQAKRLAQEVLHLSKAAMRAAKSDVAVMDREHDKVLRQACAHLWWQHAADVYERFDTARRQARKDGTYLWPRRFTGSGSLRVRLNSGARHLSMQQWLKGQGPSARLREASEQELDGLLRVKGDGGRRMVLEFAIGGRDLHGRAGVAKVLCSIHESPDLAQARVLSARLSCQTAAHGAGARSWSVSITVQQVMEPLGRTQPAQQEQDRQDRGGFTGQAARQVIIKLTDHEALPCINDLQPADPPHAQAAGTAQEADAGASLPDPVLATAFWASPAEVAASPTQDRSRDSRESQDSRDSRICEPLTVPAVLIEARLRQRQQSVRLRADFELLCAATRELLASAKGLDAPMPDSDLELALESLRDEVHAQPSLQGLLHRLTQCEKLAAEATTLAMLKPVVSDARRLAARWQAHHRAHARLDRKIDSAILAWRSKLIASLRGAHPTQEVVIEVIDGHRSGPAGPITGALARAQRRLKETRGPVHFLPRRFETGREPLENLFNADSRRVRMPIPERKSDPPR